MSSHRPRHTWVPYVAGLAGTAYLLKTVLATAGNGGVDAGPVYGVLYLAGMGLGLAAAIGAGLRMEKLIAKVVVAAGLSLLLLSWVLGIGDVLKPVVGVFTDASNVKDEIPIGVAGLAMLALAYYGYSRDQEHDRTRVAV